jgi:hypothetical protein
MFSVLILLISSTLIAQVNFNPFFLIEDKDFISCTKFDDPIVCSNKYEIKCFYTTLESTKKCHDGPSSNDESSKKCSECANGFSISEGTSITACGKIKTTACLEKAKTYSADDLKSFRVLTPEEMNEYKKGKPDDDGCAEFSNISVCKVKVISNWQTVELHSCVQCKVGYEIRTSEEETKYCGTYKIKQCYPVENAPKKSSPKKSKIPQAIKA